jgi:hypothetical protein
VLALIKQSVFFGSCCWAAIAKAGPLSQGQAESTVMFPRPSERAATAKAALGDTWLAAAMICSSNGSRSSYHSSSCGSNGRSVEQAAPLKNCMLGAQPQLYLCVLRVMIYVC